MEEAVIEKDEEAGYSDCYWASDMYYNFCDFYPEDVFIEVPEDIKKSFPEENLDSWWEKNEKEIDEVINKEWEDFFEDSIQRVIEAYPNWLKENEDED